MKENLWQKLVLKIFLLLFSALEVVRLKKSGEEWLRKAEAMENNNTELKKKLKEAEQTVQAVISDMKAVVFKHK